jgi:hypothetical protein
MPAADAGKRDSEAETVTWWMWPLALWCGVLVTAMTGLGVVEAVDWTRHHVRRPRRPAG